jgi:hypothetical protein
MHKEVTMSAKEKRDKKRAHANSKETIKLPNLMEGDYVLVATTRKSAGHNLEVQWKGPRRITSIPTAWTYEVEDLLQGRKSEVHVSRIKLYKDKDLNVTQELKDHAGHVEGTLEVDYFDGLRRSQNQAGWEIRAQWLGFGEEEATWEPVSEMIQYVPTMLREYIKEIEGTAKFPVEFTQSREYNRITEGKTFARKGKRKACAQPEVKVTRNSMKKSRVKNCVKGSQRVDDNKGSRSGEKVRPMSKTQSASRKGLSTGSSRSTERMVATRTRKGSSHCSLGLRSGKRIRIVRDKEKSLC